jgi:hypothetical protein
MRGSPIIDPAAEDRDDSSGRACRAFLVATAIPGVD